MAACAVVVGWAFTASADVPASAYVQDGLIAQWDGIENVGVGRHDPNATTWTELKQGNVNFSISGCTVGADSVTIPAQKTLTTSTSVFPSDTPNAHAGTYECYWATPDISTGASSYSAGVMLISDMSFLYRVDKNLFQGTARMADGKFYRHNFPYTAAEQTAFHTVSYSTKGTTTADNAFYLDGESRSGTVKSSENMNQSFRTGLVHSKATYPVIYKSARIYNRALTASEVRQNALVDTLRFEGADALPSGFRWNATSGKFEVLVSVACKGASGSTVSVGGSAAGVKSEAWVERGGTLTIAVSTPDGTSAQAWIGMTPEAGTKAGTFTVTVDEPVSAQVVVGSGLRTWTGAAGDGLWSTAANWEPVGVPAAGDAVVIDNGDTVTLVGATPKLADFVMNKVAGTKLVMKEPVRCAPDAAKTCLAAETVEILDGAVVTHVTEDMTTAEKNTAGSWQIDGRVAFDCTTFTLDAASKIDATAKGYHSSAVNEAACGPGGGGTDQSGSHGGYGANCSTVGANRYGCPYDDPKAPIWPGTGGAPSRGTHVAGGGIVRIAATGLVTIDGMVSADAETGGGNSQRNGAGGAIWISCGSFCGSGLLSAIGTINTGNSTVYSAGGGGMISVCYDPDEQTASDAVRGKPSLRLRTHPTHLATTRGFGGVGTVFFTDARYFGESYSAASGVQSGELHADDWTLFAPTKLDLDNAWIRLPSKVLTNLSLKSITVRGLYGRLDLGGEAMDGFGINNTFSDYCGLAYLSEVMPHVTVTGDVTLSDDAMLMLAPALTNGTEEAATWATLDVKGDIALESRSWIRLSTHPTNGASCRVFADNLRVASGCGFTASMNGFGGNVNGVSAAPYGVGSSAADISTGGAHGSYSQLANARYYKYNFPTDDPAAPVWPGMAGSNGNTARSGASGGGLVWITLTGDCELNGTLSANGAGGGGASAGGGAGGTVRLECGGVLTGTTGILTANGGSGQSGQGYKSGSGGCIAVTYDRAAEAALSPRPTIVFSASTADGDMTVGVDVGTLYLPDATLLTSEFSPKSVVNVQLYLGDWAGFPSGDVSVTNGILRLGADCPETLCFNSLTLRKGGCLKFGGERLPWHYTATRFPLETRTGRSLSIAKNLTLEGGSRLYVYGGVTNAAAVATRTYHGEILSGEVNVGGTLSVAENAWIVPVSQPREGGTHRFRAHHAAIAAGGGFNADACGFSGLGTSDANSRAAAGQLTSTGGFGPGTSYGSNGGAGFGGHGGGAASTYGVAYGSPTKWMPLPGSGSGNAGQAHKVGCPGGGLIWLEVSGTCTLNGSLLATGGRNTDDSCSSGSGGGIYLRACELLLGDSARMVAAGAQAGKANSSAGGGGRILVQTSTSGLDFGSVTNVTGGAAMATSGDKANPGEDGTFALRPYPGGTMIFVR